MSSFGVRALSMGSVFALHWLLARWMVPSEYGTYCYALTVVPLLATLANLGLPHAAVRLVPEYMALGERGLLKGFVRTSWYLVIGTSLLVTLCLLPLSWLGVGGDLRTSLTFALPMLFGFACIHLLQSFLRALKRIAGAVSIDRSGHCVPFQWDCHHGQSRTFRSRHHVGRGRD